MLRLFFYFFSAAAAAWALTLAIRAKSGASDPFADKGPCAVRVLVYWWRRSEVGGGELRADGVRGVFLCFGGCWWGRKGGGGRSSTMYGREREREVGDEWGRGGGGGRSSTMCGWEAGTWWGIKENKRARLEAQLCAKAREVVMDEGGGRRSKLSHVWERGMCWWIKEEKRKSKLSYIRKRGREITINEKRNKNRSPTYGKKEKKIILDKKRGLKSKLN